jgi:BolA protein
VSSRAEKIEQLLIDALQPESIDVVDDSHQHAGHGGYDAEGSHFSVTIVSSRFSGEDTLSRHRMIYAALGDMMHQEIHALSISAHAPDEI